MNQVEPSHTQMPQEMFPTYDADIARRHLAALDPVVFDPASGRLVITYQTYVVRTPRHTILVDTCTGEDKGYAPPMDFPKQPWLDGFRAAGLGFEDIDYVFCTHLHIDHCGWNTVLRDGRWVPTFRSSSPPSSCSPSICKRPGRWVSPCRPTCYPSPTR